ncbi:MAG: GNAT family N-acetyltransferase [Phycisphaerales bacterium]|nr:GNAT family N-acetyltransferase [Phycisphaerales bacterium]
MQSEDGIIRRYDPERDFDDLFRIFKEVGWCSSDESKSAVRIEVSAGRVMVTEIAGSAETTVQAFPGEMRYQDQEIKVAAIAGVAVSIVARRRGLTGRLLAETLAAEAADGAEVSTLHMFDQGFYDRLGYGTGAYVHRTRFDPATLKVPDLQRAAVRLTKDDWPDVHACRLKRLRGHAGHNLLPPEVTQARFHCTCKAHRFGFRDDRTGELTHHICFSVPSDSDRGPWSVWWMAYQTGEQLIELLSLLKSLDDQVHSVRMIDPVGVQMQTLLTAPFRQQTMTEKGKHEASTSCDAEWQIRILNLRACLAKTKLADDAIRFNLKLTDPIERYLPHDAVWRGIGGEYVITLGESSAAESGCDAALPTMSATVGAFSRLWLGVRPATGLAMTDELIAPGDLLSRLDTLLRLPEAQLDWGF